MKSMPPCGATAAAAATPAPCGATETTGATGKVTEPCGATLDNAALPNTSNSATHDAPLRPLHEVIRWLHKSGLRPRSFACRLGVDPNSVRRWLRLAEGADVNDKALPRWDRANAARMVYALSVIDPALLELVFTALPDAFEAAVVERQRAPQQPAEVAP